ncbi:zinc ribbon domain-containing protein [Patescibacteria group bacterium]|nr:zinc ribbon domain-containing protein [Patescibacteria group bacterium]
MNEKCSICNNEVGVLDKFCPNCGTKIESDIATLGFSTIQKIKFYTLSIILAPLGLYWFFKYFKSEDIEKKKVAFNLLYISIIMIVLLIVVNLYFVKALNSYLESYSSIYYNF